MESSDDGAEREIKIEELIVTASESSESEVVVGDHQDVHVAVESGGPKAKTSRKNRKSSPGSRKYNIVIFGASGFTGKYLVEETVRFLSEVQWNEKGEEFTWAVAGRSVDKLDKVLDQVAEKTGESLGSVKKIIADVANFESLRKMASKCDVLLNCVGPYTLWGEVVIKACLQERTHHLDLSGELQYLEKMHLLYNTEAAEKNVYIVAPCGFDSIPADLGTIYLRQNFGGELNSVEMYLGLRSSGGGKTSLNYGTYNSVIHFLSKLGELRKLNKELFPEPWPKFKFSLGQRLLHYNDAVKGWCFPNPFPDQRVVKRSQYYFYREENERPIQMKAYVSLPTLFYALLVMIGSVVVTCLAQFQIGRNILEKYPEYVTHGYISKDGPSEEEMARQKFTFTLVGHGWDEQATATAASDGGKSTKPNKTKTLLIKGTNPAYKATNIMLLQSALTILKEKDKLPAKCYYGEGLGDFCQIEGLCAQTTVNATCRAGTCQCREGHVPSWDKSRCLQIATAGLSAPCEENVQCEKSALGTLSECNQDTGLCQCYRIPAMVPTVFHGGRCYFGASLGDVCQVNAQCEAKTPNSTCGLDGKCACRQNSNNFEPGFVANQNGTACLPLAPMSSDVEVTVEVRTTAATAAAPAAECVEDAQCTRILGHFSRCDSAKGGKCECFARPPLEGATESGGSSSDAPTPMVIVGAKCYSGKSLGQPCTYHRECSAVSGNAAKCLNHVCGCEEETHVVSKDGRRCLEIGKDGLGSPCEEDEQCVKSILGPLATCGKKGGGPSEGTCGCSALLPVAFYEKTCYFRRELGATCDSDLECKAGTGGPLAECSGGRCRCESGTTTGSAVPEQGPCRVVQKFEGQARALPVPISSSADRATTGFLSKTFKICSLIFS